MISRRLIETGLCDRVDLSTRDSTGPLSADDRGLAAIVAQRTGEQNAVSADRVRQARALARSGALELREIVDSELVLFQAGDTLVATGAAGPVVVATTIPDSRRG